MKNLPADFVQLMIQHHGDAVTESLCSALLDTEPEVSVRLNTRKIEAHESLREMVQDIADEPNYRLAINSLINLPDEEYKISSNNIF